MYFVIFSVPIAAIFAAAQFILCKKSGRKIIKLIPLFISIGIIAALGLLLTDAVSSALAYYIDWGVLALIVYFAIGAAGSLFGTAAGWLIWLFKERMKKNDR